MLELCACVIGIFIEEKNQSSSKGGKAPKKKGGIKLAVEAVLKNSKGKAASGLWRYFQINHGSEDKAVHIGNYDVWFYKDPTRSGKDRLYQNHGELKTSIGFSTFKKYVAELKKSMANHSTQTAEIL